MTKTAGSPKFALITEALRRRIRDGVYPLGSRFPSVNELPEEFGVGKQTIVRVLADLARDGLIVSQQGKGTFVATSLPAAGVTPAAIRALTVAVVFRRNFDPQALALRGWFGGVVRGLAATLGFDLSALKVTRTPVRPLDADRARIEQPGNPHRIELLAEPRELDTGVPVEEVLACAPDAVLTVSVFDDAYLQRLLDAVQARNVPAVLVDYWTRPLGTRADCVVADNLPGYMAACEWLIERGLRRIHFVGAYNASHTPGHFRDPKTRRGRVEPDSYLRLAAWRQAMDEAGLAAQPEWTHFTVPMPAPMERLAEELWSLPPEERPEAVVCHHAEMAAQLRAAFERRGGTLTTIGVGEPDAGQPLTLSAEEMGRTAAALALGRIEEQARGGSERPRMKAAVPTLFENR